MIKETNKTDLEPTLIKCPKCGNAYYVEAEKSNKAIICSFCSKEVVPLTPENRAKRKP